MARIARGPHRPPMAERSDGSVFAALGLTTPPINASEFIKLPPRSPQQPHHLAHAGNTAEYKKDKLQRPSRMQPTVEEIADSVAHHG